MHTDYGLRIPPRDEIREAFGSLQKAVLITGGGLNLILLYIHNPRLIASAPEVPDHPSEFAHSLRMDANAERREREQQLAIANAKAAWDAQEKPSVNKVAGAIGVAWGTAQRLLIAGGKYRPASN